MFLQIHRKVIDLSTLRRNLAIDVLDIISSLRQSTDSVIVLKLYDDGISAEAWDHGMRHAVLVSILRDIHEKIQSHTPDIAWIRRAMKTIARIVRRYEPDLLAYQVREVYINYITDGFNRAIVLLFRPP